MSVELVNTVTGERIDLRFVEGLSISGDLSPAVIAEFEQVRRFRERWHEICSSALGVPAHLLIAHLTAHRDGRVVGAIEGVV